MSGLQIEPRDVETRLNRLERLLAGLPAEANALWDDLRAVKLYVKQRQATHDALQQDLVRCGEQLGDAQRRAAIAAGQLIAIRRLQSTLDRAQMLLALEEVVASLIGCEELALYERRGGELELVHAVGIAPATLAAMRDGDGMLARCAASASLWIDEAKGAGNRQEPRLSACVPLEVDGQSVGLLALFRLLEHKPQFEPSDIELLDLFRAHVGVALVATREPGTGGAA